MIKSPSAIGRKLAALGRADTAPEARPASMRRAGTLMLAGAGGTVLWGILSAAMLTVYRDTIDPATGKRLTATGAQTAGGVVFTLIIAIVFAGAWVLMARKNAEGRGWARITASILFLLWSLSTWTSLGSIALAALPIAVTVVTVAVWAIGAGALFLMWRPDSTAYYNATRDAQRG